MIENGLIRLRAVEPSDVDLLYEWENNQELFQFGSPNAPYSRHQLIRFVETSTGDLYTDLQIRLIVEQQIDGSYHSVGLVDAFEFDPYHLRSGIGIMVHQKYQGKGIAREAIALFVNYLFSQWGLHQVTVDVAVTNDASMALFRESNFEPIGVKKDWLKTRSGFTDVLEYQCINKQ